MYHLVDNLQTKTGDALVGYYVKLKDGDGNYATLYSDANSTPIATVSDIADTAITDANGLYDLYVADGDYSIEFFDKSDINTLVQSVPSVPMYGNATGSVVLGRLASTDAGDGASLVTLEDGTDLETKLGEVDTSLAAKATTADLASTASNKGAALINKGETDLATIAPITPYEHGAVGDDTTDDTAALQAAVTAAISQGKTLDLLTGTFKVTGSITGSGDLRCINSGGAVIHAVTGTYSSVGVLVLSGSATQVADLSSSVAKGALLLPFASSTDMAAGDIGFIYNPTDSSFSGFRTIYRAGEFFEVKSLSTNDLNLKSPLYAAYTNTAVDVYKVAPLGGFIRDIIIETDGSMASVIRLDYARGFRIDNPKIEHSNNDCIVFNRCYDCRVTQPDIRNVGDGGDDYGIVFANSQNCFALGGSSYSRRHAVAYGGDDQVGAVPCRNVITRQMDLRNDSSGGVHAADFHGHGEACGYEDCTIFGGAGIGGKNNWITGCTIYPISSGVAVIASEVLGGFYTIDNNTIHALTDPSGGSRGIIDFAGGSAEVSDDTAEDLTVNVTNNEVISSALTTSTRFVNIRNRGATVKINAEVSGNTLSVNDLFTVLYVDLVGGTGATADSDFLIVERNATALTGVKAMHGDGDYSALSVLRMPTEEWTQSVTLDTGAATKAAAAYTFKWVYPRAPAVQATCSAGIVGTKLIIAYPDTPSTTGVTLTAATPDNSNAAAAVSVTMAGRASIGEV